MNETLQLLVQYVRSAWRFRWWALGVAWVACLLGWLVIALQPDVYEGTARVYVDTSSELRQLLQGQIVESNVDDHLTFVRESMLGQTQLRRVAEQTGLAENIRRESDWPDLIELLRRQIQIHGGMIDHRGRRDNMYRISYQHPERDKALQVVDTLLTAFVEDSLGSKRTSSEAAGEFLRTQLNDYEQRLRTAEERLATFNRQHFDRLPSMQGGYFQRLQSATEELDSARQSLRLAQSRLVSIEQQLRGEAPRITSRGDVDPDSIEGRILANQARLDELLLRFTDSHPDVIATREILNQLEARRLRQNRELVSGGGGRAGSNNPVFQALQISRNEVEAEIATLRADVTDREARVGRLRELINEMPEVEAELARLNRDYDVIHAHYQSLLNSLEREQLSREVFQSEQIDFRVIDPPAVSNDPVAPKRELLLILVLMAGCGAAAGVAFVLSQLKPVFHAPAELQFATDLPVIGSVGRFWSDEESQRRTRSFALFAGGLACLGLVFVGVFLFEIVGPGLRGIL